MPTESAHIKLAVHNQKVIEYLSKDLDQYSDWITTVAFYKAVHLVEAAFARLSPRVHSSGHEARERTLKYTRAFEKAYRHYRDLLTASRIARYLGTDPKTTYESFDGFLTSKEVKDIILKHHLHQLEQSITKKLSTASRKALSKQHD